MNSHFYHITNRNLGEYVTLKAKPPDSPYQDDTGEVIEDWFTPRVSLAPHPIHAVHALMPLSRDPVHLYEVPRSAVKIVDPTSLRHPMLRQGSYGTHFRWQDFADNYKVNSSKKEEILRWAVPDSHLTREIWSLDPVPARYVGEIPPHTISQWIARLESSGMHTDV